MTAASALESGGGTEETEDAALPHRTILGMRVDATSYERATEQVVRWARASEARYVCIANVHMVMEAHDRPDFQRVVNAADLVTSDGMPLVWALRLLGISTATRVYGPDLTLALCAAAAEAGIPVGFYGGSPRVLSGMVQNLRARFPLLDIAYYHSPPFGQLEPAEVAREIDDIRGSRARILFVGLGCPKQERWMAARRGQLDAVMLGVGAAFDFIAGEKAMAPDWMQSLGLEWAFRLGTEPRRLWRRYLYHNPRFLGHFAAQLARDRWRPAARHS